jgi:hypothetical protein
MEKALGRVKCQFLRVQPFRETIGHLMNLLIVDLPGDPPIAPDFLVDRSALVAHIRIPNPGDELSSVDFVPAKLKAIACASITSLRAVRGHANSARRRSPAPRIGSVGLGIRQPVVQ